MPFSPVELNIFLGIIGMTFASTNAYIGLHYFVLRKYEKLDPLLLRLHHLFGAIGTTFFYIIAFLCFMTFLDSWSLGTPPKDLDVTSSYFIHSFVGFVAVPIFSLKVVFGYFKPKYVQNRAKQFGVFVAFAWLAVWSTSVWDYYWHSIPDLGFDPFYIEPLYFSEMVIVSALITFLIPFLTALILYLVIRTQIKTKEKIEEE
ncbi:MAG: hypothetical protein ACFFDT_39915 [Candidatus Hodarchaeota archaeon]